MFPMHSIPFSEARAHLAETLHQLESGNEPVLISRRGQATGVLMSVQQFKQLSAPAACFTSRLTQWRTEHSSAITDGKDDNPFENTRDTGRDRETAW
jgi:prevent-host-death family protein